MIGEIDGSKPLWHRLLNLPIALVFMTVLVLGSALAAVIIGIGYAFVAWFILANTAISLAFRGR